MFYDTSFFLLKKAKVHSKSQVRNGWYHFAPRRLGETKYFYFFSKKVSSRKGTKPVRRGGQAAKGLILCEKKMDKNLLPD